MDKKAFQALKREFCAKTHAELAAKIDVHLETVKGWSMGKYSPSRISLLRIEAARAKLAAEGK